MAKVPQAQPMQVPQVGPAPEFLAMAGAVVGEREIDLRFQQSLETKGKAK